MKRTATAMIASLVIAVTVSASATEKPGWGRRTFGTLTWEEVAQTVETPKDIASAVRHHVDYKEDLGDEWQSGKTTWEKATGDCEDIAAAVVDLCKEKGYEATVLIIHPKDGWEAHAIAIGLYQGKLWIASNGWYETVKSVEDAKQKVAKEMGWRHREIAAKTLDQVIPGTAPAKKVD